MLLKKKFNIPNGEFKYLASIPCDNSSSAVAKSFTSFSGGIGSDNFNISDSISSFNVLIKKKNT